MKKRKLIDARLETMGKNLDDLLKENRQAQDRPDIEPGRDK